VPILCFKAMKIEALPFAILILLSGCGDIPQDPGPSSTGDPKVIKLEFEGEFTGTSEDWSLLNETVTSQFNFNIVSYPTVDSVIFKASLRSERENIRCVVELFNVTDEIPIQGSALFSQIRYQLHSVRSSNILQNFPNKEIGLGVRIRSESSINYVEARHFSLLIYYH
jgi:hypothetical protein